MATIVQHKESQNHYIFLGTGFGIYKASRSGPGAFASILPIEEQDHFRLVAVADRHGNIKWFHSEDLTVIEVEGLHPSELI